MSDKDYSMSQQIEEILNEVLHEEEEEDKQISQIDDETLLIKEQEYKIIANYRQGFEAEGFANIYNSFFEKYDYIVGDWGHEKLRLRGFYQIGRRKVPRDQQIDFLDDYIKEYCNFGCAYFVLAKVEAVNQYSDLLHKKSKTRHRKTSSSNNNRRNTISVNTQDKIGSRNNRHSKSKNSGKKAFNRKQIQSNKNKKKFNPETQNHLKNNDFVIKRRKKGDD